MNAGKCVLVTGASSNIGQGIALALARDGYDIAFSYSENKAGAEDTIHLCEEYGVKVRAFQAQLNEADGPEKLVEEVHAAFGHIDAFVSNAGRSFHKSIVAITREEMEDIYHLDFRGYMLCAKAVARHMIRDGIQGSIVFISSSQGDQAYAGGFLYCGIKAAVNQACKALAMDLSHYGIRVNVVAPGAIRSNTDHPSPKKVRMHAQNGTPEKAFEKVEDLNERPFAKKNILMHRFGSPEDIGQAADYLISERSSYVTGITIRVDGGLILPGVLQGEEPFTWVNHDYWEKERELSKEELIPGQRNPERKNGRKHTIVLTNRRGEELEKLTGGLTEQDVSVVPFADYEQGLADAYQQYGYVDQLLVDCEKEEPCSVINATPEYLDGIFEHGFLRYMLAARDTAKYMIKDHTEGNMVFLFRNHARHAMPTSFADSGMDAAMEHAIWCIAADLGHYGIRVNGIAVDTAINKTNPENIPMKVSPENEDIRALVRFLSDPSAACMTGDTVYADYASSIPTAHEAIDYVQWCPEEFWTDAYEKAFGGK